MPWKSVVGEDPTRPASAAAARSSASKLGSKVEIAQAHENELDGRLLNPGLNQELWMKPKTKTLSCPSPIERVFTFSFGRLHDPKNASEATRTFSV